MFKLDMFKKGFEAEMSLNQTPSIKELADKPLKSEEKPYKKVDINILKQELKKSKIKKIKKYSIFVFYNFTQCHRYLYFNIKSL